MGDISFTMQRSTAGVRVGEPPLALTGELARPDLVTRLAGRWTAPVTAVVAGAGFGKSTLLAQACRADAAAPPGLQAWVSCTPDHEQATDLAASICASLDAAPGAREPLVATLDALRRLAPLDVCLVLDDVHHVGAGTAGAALLAGLVGDLPANAHVVLSGRVLPALPLARLRAADRLIELGEDDLAFRPGEVERLAAASGRPAAVAAPFGGWPALVRVALAARPGVAIGFAREEVLAELPEHDRHALLALATTGAADEALVSRVIGAPADLDRLATVVPMVRRLDEDRFEAHDLWLDALARSVDADDARSIRERAVVELLAANDLGRAGDVAITAGDWDALSSVAVTLVRTTISVLPVPLAVRWLDAAKGVDPSPEMRLLAATLRTATNFSDASVDAELDAIADDFRARGDAAGEVTALSVGTSAARARGDRDRLVALALRTAAVPGAQDHPVVRVSACTIAAMVAEMHGDPEGALRAFDELPTEGVPAPLGVSANRFLMHCLLLAGRADEAVIVADRLADGPSDHCRTMGAFTRWQAGVPGFFADSDVSAIEGASDRDAFVARAFHAVIAASHGEVVAFEDGRFGLDNARDAAVIGNARAAHAILRRDDDAAARAIADVLERHPDDRLADRHLRRFLALGYVLDPALRGRWDAAEVGPSHDRARRVARLLVDLRRHDVRQPPSVDPALVLTVLPLPWSVELACRLHESGADDGRRLLEWLLDHVGCRVHTELRTHTGAGDRRLAEGAASLLARIPREPDAVVAIDVLGPLRVQRGGVSHAGGDLRRQRVRELLAMLVVEGTVTRDRAIEALWPDLDMGAGGRNLRVTLTYLRRLLEPDRETGEPSFHVRADASSIRLVASAKLRVDLWEHRRLLAAVPVLRATGDVEATIELLAEATALWRGAPLTDLDRVPGFEAEIERIRLAQTASLLDLGSLRLTVGDAGGALAAAEQALTLEPYLEAAHRLAIAAAVQRGDRTRVLAALGRVTRMLDELGVRPEPATEMLMRAAARDGAVTALAS
jgi:DNA-binding SARP family transcriptional activator